MSDFRNGLMTDGINANLNVNKSLNIGENSIQPIQNEEQLLFKSNEDLSNDSEDFRVLSNNDNEQKLRQQLQDVENEQGIIGNFCNGFKSLIGIGNNSDNCKELIEEYKHGKISYEEAEKEISKFKTAQKDDVNFITNTATYVAGFAAGASVIATGGAALPVFIAAIGVGSAAGAFTKTGLKVIDRASNNIDGDALDNTEVKKDIISGAIGGGATVATGGIGRAVSSAGSILKSAVLPNFKLGAIDGTITGAADYIIDVKHDDNSEFNLSDFAKTTTVGALSFGVAGGVRGAVSHSLAGKVIGKIVDNLKEVRNKIVQSAANLFGKNGGVSIENASAGELGLYMND